MRVLFIYPKPNVVFDPAHSLPLGMGYIASILEKEGHKVSVFDLNVQDDNLEERLSDVDIVGIYAKTVHIKSAWKICDRIKKCNEKILTVLGGPHPSVMPDESLIKTSVDFVIRREGELTFKELCEKIGDSPQGTVPNFSDIAGLSYKENGKIIHAPDRELINNLDELSFPAYHLFPFDSYTTTRPTWFNKRKFRPATIITSRGCPYKCVFCFQGIHGNKYRYRSPENVVSEIKFLKEKYGINFIEILDDNFALIGKRVEKICELLIKENLNIKWSVPEGFVRVDLISRDLLRLAKRSGCVDFWFAIESGSQNVLTNIINKGTTVDQIKEAVRIAKSEKFEVGAFVCIGNLGETKEDIKKTIELICSLDLDKCQFTVVTPYPGSRLYDILVKENKLLVKDWDYYSPYENKAFFEYNGMTKEKIEEMYKLAFRKFYIRPSYIYRTLKNPTTYMNLPLILKEIWHFFF